jgi:hypothetical protein
MSMIRSSPRDDVLSNNNNNNNNHHLILNYLCANSTAKEPFKNCSRVKETNKHKVQNKAIYNAWVMSIIIKQ